MGKQSVELLFTVILSLLGICVAFMQLWITSNIRHLSKRQDDNKARIEALEGERNEVWNEVRSVDRECERKRRNLITEIKEWTKEKLDK